jgi:rhodanese-related sulfurtransferase
VFGALARLFRPVPLEPRWIAVDQLRHRLGEPAGPLVIDVRGRDEFDGPLGHIEGALNIPLPDFAVQRERIAAAGRPVVLVCLTDKRSSAAAAQLTSEGRSDVFVLRGGMTAWNAGR